MVEETYLRKQLNYNIKNILIKLVLLAYVNIFIK